MSTIPIESLSAKYMNEEITVDSLVNLSLDVIGTAVSDGSGDLRATKLLNIDQDELDKMCEFCSNKIKCELSKQKPIDVKITLVPSGKSTYVPKLKCNFL